jgi:CheY-like chemotaxis protein
MTKDPINILLVDDQPAKLLTYEAILQGLGENLIKAGSAREALEHLLKEDIAIVLSIPTLNAGEHVCIELTDTGSGMDEATLLRASDHRQRAGQGHGIGSLHGLWPCRAIPGRLISCEPSWCWDNGRALLSRSSFAHRRRV